MNTDAINLICEKLGTTFENPKLRKKDETLKEN